ncbi:DUF533 domain-containing protein [Baaleninema sp.]|uniref:DUF533 domain-containing protein n=1 Tax=Baaleninema sp. TaxID=3101197 RepID=UPI003CFE9CA7
MADTQQNAIACLQILAAIAKADGDILEEEKQALVKAVEALRSLLREDVTVDRLLQQEYSPDEIATNLDDPTLQVLLYEAAQSMAEIHGTVPAEQTILDTLGRTFNLKELNIVRLDIAIDKLQAALLPNSDRQQMARMAQRNRIAAEVRQLSLDYAIGISILGFNPFPGLTLATTLLAFFLILKMMRDIGVKWGYPKNLARLAVLGNLFSGIGAIVAGLSVWATLSFIGFWVPVFGYFGLPGFFFTTTWAIGRATSLYYSSEGRLPAQL